MRQPRTISEVVHEWAHQVREEAKCGNVSYRGTVLYSYAEPIARIFDNFVLVTSVYFSHTTSQHVSKARGATHHMRGVFAPVIAEWGSRDINNVHKLNDKAWRKRLEVALLELENHPRRKLSVGAKIGAIIQARQAYCEAFKLDWQNDLDALKAEYAEAVKIRADIEASERAELERLRKEREKEDAEWLERWRNGEHVQRLFTLTALRIRGDEIETTHGARIPVDDARKAWPWLLRWYAEGRTISTVDTRFSFGHYPFTRFEQDGTLVVGCHTIPWAEVEYIARELGLVDKEAA